MSGRNINKEEFNNLQDLSDKIKFCLRYAVLAPSVHNTQPWKFKLTDNSCKFYKDPELRLAKADPKDRYLHIALGACIENFVLAGKAFGIFREVLYKSDEENLVAEVVCENGNINPAYEIFLDLI